MRRIKSNSKEWAITCIEIAIPIITAIPSFIALFFIAYILSGKCENVIAATAYGISLQLVFYIAGKMIQTAFEEIRQKRAKERHAKKGHSNEQVS